MRHHLSRTLLIVMTCALALVSVTNTACAGNAFASKQVQVAGIEARSPETMTQPALSDDAVTPSPADVIRQFYAWFVKADYPEPNTHKSTFRRYVTDAGIRKAIKATDYVYFTQAQDSDPAWGTNIAVTITSSTATKTVARVKLGKAEFINDLTVELLKVGGVWKINNVKRNF